MFNYNRIADGADWFHPEIKAQQERRPEFNVPGRNNWAFLLIDKCMKDLCVNFGSAIGLGVGTEPLPIFAADYGFEKVIATEYSPAGWGGSLEKMAEAYAEYPQIEVRHEDMLETPGSGEKFDLIWSNCSPEHVGTDEQIFDMMTGLYENNLNDGGVMVMLFECRVLGPTVLQPGICFLSQDWIQRLINEIPVIDPVKMHGSSHAFNNTTPLWARGPKRLSTELFLFEHPDGFLSTSINLVWKKGAKGFSQILPPNPEILRRNIQQGREIYEWADTRNYDTLPAIDIYLEKKTPEIDTSAYCLFAERVFQKKQRPITVGLLGISNVSVALESNLKKVLGKNVTVRTVGDGMNREGTLNESSRCNVEKNIHAAEADCWLLCHQSYSAIEAQHQLLWGALDNPETIPVYAAKNSRQSNELFRLKNSPVTPYFRRFLDAPRPIFDVAAEIVIENVLEKTSQLGGDYLMAGYINQHIVNKISDHCPGTNQCHHVVLNSVYPAVEKNLANRHFLANVNPPNATFVPEKKTEKLCNINDLSKTVVGDRLSFVYVRQDLAVDELYDFFNHVNSKLVIKGHIFFDCTVAAGGTVFAMILEQTIRSWPEYYFYKSGLHQWIGVKLE